MFHEKLKRLTHQNKHGSKQTQNHGSMEEWQQELSHDDIVRVLFDLGSAAECKEEETTDVSLENEMHTSTKDNKHHIHPRKKAKRSKSTVEEEEQERDQLQQLLV